MSEISKQLFLSAPVLCGNEWKYVKECLDSGWVSSAGPLLERFEKEICSVTGAKYAVACTNGSIALYMSLYLLGIGPGDEVIVPTVTFIAPVNSIKWIGADPVFMDCDHYYNIDIDKVITFLRKETVMKRGVAFNKITKKPIKAIIPVHVFGNAANLKPLISICREMNIKIVEDATESLGARYRESINGKRHPGAIGDIGCLSFNGNKIVTTGGGGMILLNDQRLKSRARYLMTQAKNDSVMSIHDEMGFNFRMTNLQAALGIAQLENLNSFLKTRRANYFVYKTLISDIPGLKLGEVPPYADNNYWMYALQIDHKVYGISRNKVLNVFLKRNIEVRPLWYLNHLQKPYAKNLAYRIECAYRMWESTLNLPCSSNLKRSEMKRVVEVLNNCRLS